MLWEDKVKGSGRVHSRYLLSRSQDAVCYGKMIVLSDEVRKGWLEDMRILETLVR